MAFDLLDIVDPLHLRNLASARGAGKKLRVNLEGKWLAASWPMTTWDAAYALLERAGMGDAAAKKELDSIKIAAHGGHPQAVAAKRNFDAVSKLIIKGLPRPSAFVASQAKRKAKAQQQTATIRKQQEQIKEMKRAQLERARRESLQKKASLRIQQEQEKADVEIEAIQAERDLLRRQLERRELADDVRAQLEAQAEKYEAVIEELERRKSGAPPAATVTEATIAERQEAEQDDSAAAYSSGVPGDVEYNDAGH